MLIARPLTPIVAKKTEPAPARLGRPGGYRSIARFAQSAATRAQELGGSGWRALRLAWRRCCAPGSAVAIQPVDD